MKKMKKICDRLLFPPVWLILLLTPISAGVLVLIFSRGWDTEPLAYAGYVLSAYTMTVIVARCVTVLPGKVRQVRQRVLDTKYGGRYMTDVVFKTHVTLYASLGLNLLYVVSHFLSGITNRSAWFYILAAYYLILSVMRILLARFVRRVGIGKDLRMEIRRTRLCGAILLTLNLVLSGAVLMMLHQNRSFEYRGYLIYVMAGYTFYVTINAVVNIVKYRKYHSPVLSATKNITLAAALVSMLSLETAMLSRFGGESTPEFRRLMIALSGAAISVTVIGLSLSMIFRKVRPETAVSEDVKEN
ncbi:MAG: hypothetical protein ACI3XR_10170 [Eubacteriales bacterium]